MQHDKQQCFIYMALPKLVLVAEHFPVDQDFPC